MANDYMANPEYEAYFKRMRDGPTVKELYQKELETLLVNRDAVRAKQMQRYDDRSATRVRTTTSNAEADRLNERIVWLRSGLKKEA